MYLNFHIKVYVPKLIEWPIVAIVLWYRRKRHNSTFRRIKLNKGRYATVDVEDYEKLARYDWQLYESKCGNFYAVRSENGLLVKMHRVVMNAPAGFLVDHKSGNGLDNRKANLRIVTAAQNSYNMRKRTKTCSSKYKGVSKVKKNNKWRAYININSKYKHLGYFDNEIDAAGAYDEAAKKYFGEFAKLNFDNYSHKGTKTQSFKLFISFLRDFASWCYKNLSNPRNPRLGDYFLFNFLFVRQMPAGKVDYNAWDSHYKPGEPLSQRQYKALAARYLCNLAEQAFKAELHNARSADAYWDNAYYPGKRKEHKIVPQMGLDTEVFAYQVQAEKGQRLAGKGKSNRQKQGKGFAAVKFYGFDDAADP